MKCTSRCGKIRPTIIDEITAKITCPIHSSYYIYKNDLVKWESAEQKRERMKGIAVCETCGNDFDYVPTVTAMKTCHSSDCPTCAKAKLAAREKARHARLRKIAVLGGKASARKRYAAFYIRKGEVISK